MEQNTVQLRIQRRITVDAIKREIRQRIIDQWRDEGFAVIVWSPEELQGASPDRVQDRSIELGWDIIDDLKGE